MPFSSLPPSFPRKRESRAAVCRLPLDPAFAGVTAKGFTSVLFPEAVGFARHRGGALALRRGTDHIDQAFQAFEIMHRAELVDIGQHRLHAERSWLEPLV